MRAALFLALVAALAGCQSEKFERFTSRDDGISFRHLGEGWTLHRERGSLVFSASEPGLEHATLVLRSVRVPESERRWRAPREIFASTKAVLESLPDARVAAPRSLSPGDFRGELFSLSFTSRATGERYERRHAVVVSGDGGRIVHVFATAPPGDLDRIQGVFDQVIASLRVEG